MAKIDLAAITAPLGDEQPCGPDLDMGFDMDFMNFTAEIDGRIPTAFFSFEPGSLDFASYYDRIGDLLQRTRDIRVLVPLAKLRILQYDLPGFAETLEAIHRLLKERWSDLHPRPAEFLELGMGQLATLDDMPNRKSATSRSGCRPGSTTTSTAARRTRPRRPRRASRWPMPKSRSGRTKRTRATISLSSTFARTTSWKAWMSGLRLVSRMPGGV